MSDPRLRLPKGEKRATTKRRRDRVARKVVGSVRAACVIRDGRCRLAQGEFWDNDDFHVGGEKWLRHDCSGDSEWAHFGDKRRARTRGQAAEIRHTTAGSLMLCQAAHRAYDAGTLQITALTRAGCDGRLKFRWKS